MRDHVMKALIGIAADAERLREVLATAGTAAYDETRFSAAILDLVDRLAEERAWLASQPLSSLLDHDERTFMSRHRLLVYRSSALGEHVLINKDEDDISAWLNSLAGLLALVPDPPQDAGLPPSGRPH